ncbi:MAG: arginyltransferase [Oleiphilaceae bacterium]|uniref:arginyltransferase n=1 Tax=Oleiphilus sp. HI0125 TaxID=1822266 RepID=UPI0007C3E8CA|nr:arginyltransferase [Oleiphilus sp. HI0125]KZZ59439.1 arginyltransferase [Oleiphilus sp. HI0125]MCH2157176.1 arginyltransferase [Oleiphilaceae bacterium]
MSHLETMVFYATPEHDCSYLPGAKATTMFADPNANISNNVYKQLSELGFRRSGSHYYRPHCLQCNACIPVRVLANDFKPSRSQKRVLKNAQGIQAQSLSADFHEDHYLLYEKYINARHVDGDMYPASREQYRSFLVDGRDCTRFVEFTLEGQLLGIAVVDELDDGLSAIYTFFDPDVEHLSIGTYAILWQLLEAKKRNLPYVYLGYFIKECRKMSYKTAFKPFQTRIDERWLTIEELQAISEKYK